jgi:hypothetical protein
MSKNKIIVFIYHPKLLDLTVYFYSLMTILFEQLIIIQVINKSSTFFKPESSSPFIRTIFSNVNIYNILSRFSD